MDRLRSNPPKELAGSAVTEVTDLSKGWDGLPGTNAIMVLTEANDRVIARPSGTEPKLKCYLEVILPVEDGVEVPWETARKKLTWKNFENGMLVCHQAFFARTKLAKTTPYDLTYRFSADFDWCVRILKQAAVIYHTHLTLIDYLNEGMTTENH